MTRIETIASFLCRYCRVLGLIMILSTAVPVLYLCGLGFDNSVKMWLDQSSTPYQQYEAFLSRYGSDEFTLIVCETESPFSDESLALQRQLANRLQEIDKVEQVLSVPHYLDALWKGKAGWERMGRPSDYLLDILTGPNHKHIGTYVMLQAQIDPADKDRAMQVIEAVTSDVCKGKAKAHLVGIPVLAATLTQAAKISSMRYLPLALLACLIALAVSLRSARAVLAVMVSVGVASIWTTGLIAMTGRSLNLITSAIPTVISVLALANGIHIASEFLTECRPTHNRFRVMRRVLTRLIGPVVFTSITTAVGFGSLALSQMKPISEMGMFMSIGIMISGVCNLMEQCETFKAYISA